MKRIMTLLLTLSLTLLALAACGPQKRSVTGKAFEDQFKIEMTFSDAPDGKTFDHKEKNDFYSVTYKGRSDKDENITEFSIVITDIHTAVIRNEAMMDKTIRKSGNQLTIGELSSHATFVCLLGSYMVVGGLDIDDFDKCGPLLATICRGEPLVVEGWTLTVTISDSDRTATISAIN